MTNQINMHRALLIDPHTRTVREMFVETGIDGMYYALGQADKDFSGMVECVNLAQIPVRGIDAWMDEEANLTEGRPVFHIMGDEGTKLTFAGFVLVLDNDGEGESIGTEIETGRLAAQIVWTDLETTGEFGPSREYVTEHPIFGKCPVYEGGKPVYRERAAL